jgi:hypothetical protein
MTAATRNVIGAAHRSASCYTAGAQLSGVRNLTLSLADVERRAKSAEIETGSFIHGEYTPAVCGETFDCISPVDGRRPGFVETLTLRCRSFVANS